MNKEEFPPIVEKAIAHFGGVATPVQVAKYFWDNHEDELRASGSLFYTWQYDLRWAKQKLQDEGKVETPKRGIWRLKESK